MRPFEFDRLVSVETRSERIAVVLPVTTGEYAQATRGQSRFWHSTGVLWPRFVIGAVAGSLVSFIAVMLLRDGDGSGLVRELAVSAGLFAVVVLVGGILRAIGLDIESRFAWAEEAEPGQLMEDEHWTNPVVCVPGPWRWVPREHLHRWVRELVAEWNARARLEALGRIDPHAEADGSDDTSGGSHDHTAELRELQQEVEKRRARIAELYAANERGAVRGAKRAARAQRKQARERERSGRGGSTDALGGAGSAGGGGDGG